MVDGKRRRRWKKGPACPRCGARTTVAILYGMPSSGTFEAIDRGEIPEVAIGACVVLPTNPVWACPECEHRW